MPEGFLLLPLSGTLFYIYSLFSREKVNIYNRDVDLIDRQKFLKLQWISSFIISIFLIVSGVIMYIVNPPSHNLYLPIIFFHIFISISKFIGKKLKYIK